MMMYLGEQGKEGNHDPCRSYYRVDRIIRDWILLRASSRIGVFDGEDPVEDPDGSPDR